MKVCSMLMGKWFICDRASRAIQMADYLGILHKKEAQAGSLVCAVLKD